MSRQTQYFDIGVQGRKTGVQVPTQERDAHGLENPEGFFTPSPAPQKTTKPLNAFLAGTQAHGAGTGAATGSPAPPTTTATSKLQVPEIGDVTISGEETMDFDSGPGSEPVHRHSSPGVSTNPTLDSQQPRARSPFKPPIKDLSTSEHPILSSPPRREPSVEPNTPNLAFTPVNPRQPSASPTRSIPESSATTGNINRVLNFQTEEHGGVLNSPVITGQPARRPRTPSVPPPARSALQAKALRKKDMPFPSPATHQSVVEKKSEIDKNETGKKKEGESLSGRREDGSTNGLLTALPTATKVDERKVIEKEKTGYATTTHSAGGNPTTTSTPTAPTSTSKSAPIKTAIQNQQTTKSKPAPAAVSKRPSQPLAATKKRLLSSRAPVSSSQLPPPFSLSDDDGGEGDNSLETGRAADEDEDMEDIEVGISGKKWKAPKPAAPVKPQSVSKSAAKADTKKTSVAGEKSGKGKGKAKKQAPDDIQEDEVEQETIVEEEDNRLQEEEEEEEELENAEDEQEGEIPVPVSRKGKKASAPPAEGERKTKQVKAVLKPATALNSRKKKQPSPVSEEEEIDEAQDPEPVSIPIRQKKPSKKETAEAKTKAEKEAAAEAKISKGKKGKLVIQSGEEADEAVSPLQSKKRGGAVASTTIATSSFSIPSSSTATKGKQTRGKKTAPEPEPELELVEQGDVSEEVVPKGRKAGKKSKEVPSGTAEEIPKAVTRTKRGKGGGKITTPSVNVEPQEEHEEVVEPEPVPEAKGRGKNTKSQGKGKAKAAPETEVAPEHTPVGKSTKTSKSTTAPTSKAAKTNATDKTGPTTTAKGRGGRGQRKGKAAAQDDDEEMPDADSDAAAASSQLAQEASANNSYVYSDNEDQHEDASPPKKLRRAGGGSSAVASSSASQRPTKSSLSKPQSKSLSPDHLPPPRGSQKVSIAPLTAPEISPSDANKRRSARARIAPLSFWAGEKVLTTVIPPSKETRRKDGNDAAVKIEVRKEVVRVEAIDNAKPKAKSSKSKGSRARSGSVALRDEGEAGPRGKKRKRGVQRSRDHEEQKDGYSTTSDSESDLEPWEEGEGCFKGMVKARDGSGEMVEEIIAYSSHSMITNPVASSAFRMNKTISLDHLGTGIIEIPSGGQKRWKPSGKFDLVFYVIKGKVWVAVGDNSFTIRKGGQFQVSKGNLYTIENHFTPTAKLFFVQGCDNSS